MTHGFVTVDENDQPVSAVPEGIRDLASLGDNLLLDPDVEEKLATIFEELAGENRSELSAKYKIEIAFTEGRSRDKAFGGFIYAVSNGGFAHGGGDEGIYFCTAKIDKNGVTKRCNAPLRPAWVGKEAAVCPECRQATKPKDLMGQVWARLTFQNWARLAERFFHALGGDADIRIGVMKGDLRVLTEDEMERSSRGEKLDRARVEREWVIYPLANIIKDTAAGATLSSRISAFLKA